MKKILFLILFIGTYELISQVATVPFTENGLVFIEVQVEGSKENLSFVFDTGASTAVMDATIASKLGIVSNYTQEATGASGSQEYDIATKQKLSIEGIQFSNLNLVLVDLKALSQRVGVPIDGIIGYNILQKFITEFDFEKKVLRLYRDIKDVQSINSYTSYPMKLRGSIPKVNLEYTLKNNEKLSGDFLFDSGANLTVLFNTPYAKNNNLSEKTGKTITITSRGLTTESNTISGTLAGLDFFDFSFNELPIGIAQAHAGVSASKRHAGILGAKIINRFDMVLDYQNKKFYFKPNSQYSKPFEYPLSGFALEKTSTAIIVSQVIDDTEAHTKGLQKGDTIHSINDQETTILKTYRDILKKDGETVHIKFQKPTGEIKTIAITLKRII